MGTRAALQVVTHLHRAHVVEAENLAAGVIRAADERASDTHPRELAAVFPLTDTLPLSAVQVVADLHRAHVAAAENLAAVGVRAAEERAADAYAREFASAIDEPG